MHDKNLDNRSRHTSNSVFSVLAALMMLLAVYALLRIGARITGPFIFLDELEYFSYARDLATGDDLQTHTQYGVFYPAITSLFFRFGDVEFVYSCLRSLNLAFLVSSAYPALLIVRALSPTRWLAWLFPIYVVIAPFSGFVHIVWAEPLYYLLFLWTVYALLMFYRYATVTYGLLCGGLLALLFHTKAGAGLVVQIAAFMSLAGVVAPTAPQERRRLAFPILTLVLSNLTLTVPWMIRNVALGVGLIGYGGGESDLALRLAEDGLVAFGANLVAAGFYQLAYVFIGSWGLAGIVLAWPAIHWRTITVQIRALIIFAIACVAGLMALSAIGVTAYRSLGYWIPNGRYYCIVFPLLILLALWMLGTRTPMTRTQTASLCAVTLILGVVALVATPLRVAAPMSFVNNPELALPIWLIDAGKVVWRSSYDPPFSQRFYLAAAISLVGLATILASGRPKLFTLAVVSIFAGSLLTSAAEHHYVKMISMSQRGMNDVVKFLLLPSTSVVDVKFDPTLKSSNLENIARFWSPSTQVEYADDAAIGFRDRKESTLFVSHDILPLPIIFSSHGLFVYRTTIDTP